MSAVRFDRLITVGLCHPLARLRPARLGPRIPILMYHGLEQNSQQRHPYYETTTAPLTFEQQMKHLKDRGYEAVSLEGALAALRAGDTSKQRVVITFDDGYRSFYTTAFPILSSYAFTATVFLISSLTSDRRLRWNGSELLTWVEVRELHANGMDIGSHTATHPKLRDLQPAAMDEELRRSKGTIEDVLGYSVTTFAYPYAFPEADRGFRARLRESLGHFGYTAGVNTIIGTARPTHEHYFLPRLPVNSWDDPRLFAAKLEGGYEWLHGLQYCKKLLSFAGN